MLCSPWRAAAAEQGPEYAITVALGLETNSVFRGTKSEKLNPSVYGVLELERDAAFAGVFASPISIQDELTSLLVGYWGYAPTVYGLELTFGGRYYAFPGTRDFEFDLNGDSVPEKIGKKGLIEVYGEVEKAIGPLIVGGAVNFSPNTFGETGKAFYYIGTVKFDLGNDFSVRGHAGRSAYNDNVYNDNYTDYAIGVYKSAFGFDMFLRYSDTSGLAGANNEIVVFGIEKAWNISSNEKAYKRRLRQKIINDLRLDKSQLFSFGY